MIENDKQLKITLECLSGFKNALKDLEEKAEVFENPKWLRKAYREAIESEILNLQNQINEYQNSKKGGS